MTLTLYASGKKVGKTHVEKATLNPVWNFHTNVAFDDSKPIDLIEVFVWDKDKLKDAKIKDILLFKKDAIKDDFLGKISIQLEHLFDLVAGGGKSSMKRFLEYDAPENKELVLSLEKRKIDDNVSGDIQIKVGTIHL